jgi:hypothetical protein
MLNGDLTSTPLAPLLLDLADDLSTGCLNITDSAGEEALVYYKAGLVYSVSVPGTRPQLGAKLVSSGALAPEALAEALEAQRTELQGWRLGELLVHLGYVDQPVVEAFVKEQVSEALWDLLRWSDGRWKFRKNVKAREDVGPAMVVVDLLESLRDRGYEWETISAVVHGPAAVPVLSARGNATAETTLDNDAWSMLCKIDGERSVADLARDCGYTLFEAGHVIVSLVQAGLVDIDEDIDVAGSELYGATTLSSALAGELDDEGSSETTDDAALSADTPDGGEEDVMTRLARLVNEVAGNHSPDDGTTADQPAADADAVPCDPQPAIAVAIADQPGARYDNPMLVPLHRHSNESFAASIARVSSALSEVLGDAPAFTETYEELQTRQAERRRTASSTTDPEWQRHKRLRAAAAAELAIAHAFAETMRPDQDAVAIEHPEYTGEIPKVVRTESERHRAAVRAAEEAERHAAEESARADAEQFARAAAQAAERHATEQAAQQAEAEAAVRAVAAQAAEAAAAQLAADQLAAEDAARQAAEAVEAAAEQERQEADAAAELERLAAEAAAEAERQAAAEAERLAAEEAERLAAEETARQAAEAAAEQERQEADAAAEADRQAAETAAQAAAEAERLAVEDAERLAVEEAVHAAVAAKAERAAQRKAEKLAAEEAARLEDQTAAATKLLLEIAAGSDAEPVAEAVAPTEPEAAPTEPEPAAAAAPKPPATSTEWDDSGMADTAALLRELSSLGVDDNDQPRTGPIMTRAPRPTTDKKVKKKIGLFGR